MSRKDYVKIAKALNGINDAIIKSNGAMHFQTFWHTVKVITDCLQEDNSRFSKDKFLEAVYNAKYSPIT